MYMCYVAMSLTYEDRTHASARAPMASTRSRHRGVAPLLDVFRKHATRPNFIMYDTTRNTAKLRVDLISPQSEMIRDIFAVAPSLALVQSESEEALKQVRDERKHDVAWARLQDDQVREWAKLQATRLRIMLRHVSQAHGRKPPPKWVCALQLGRSAGAVRGPDVLESVAEREAEQADPDEGEAEEATEAEEAEEEEDEAEEDEEEKCDEAIEPHRRMVQKGPETGWFFGYDRGSGKAWRAPSAHPKQKELCERIFVPDGASAIDSPVAVFSDGRTWRINCLTCEEFEGTAAHIHTHAARKKPAGAPGRRPLWQSEQDGVKLKVCLGSDSGISCRRLSS